MHAEPQIEVKIAQAAHQRQWQAFGLFVAMLAGVLAVFWPTVRGMIEIWNESGHFTHGWLVIPAVVWFAWERRQRLAEIPLRPFWPGLLVVATGGFVWLAANVAGVAVIEQLAAVGLVGACVLTVFGWRFAWELAFPLGFLFFAVPMGEALVPLMTSMTADFTVGALRLSGIPVYREGMFFVIPSGNWSIVEACSGLRYLIASVTVGCVFAYLYYRSLWRRLAFVAASIVVPIIANWLRAYMIVMLGHLSGNRLAVGVDHLIYGWVFFGFVMLLLFWLGSRWREDDAPAPADPRRADSRNIALPGVGMAQIGGAALATLLMVAAWPAWSAYLTHRADSDKRIVELTAPLDSGGWQRQTEQATDWRPDYKGAAASIFETYSRNGQQVVLFIAVYRNQKQGAELISSTNYLIHEQHRAWRKIGESRRGESSGRQSSLQLRQTLLRGSGQTLLIWDWFVVSGQDVVNPYLAKLLQARDQVLGRGDDGMTIIVAAPYVDTTAAAEQALRDFVVAMRPSIDAATAKALGR
jgi:exosortase A